MSRQRAIVVGASLAGVQSVRGLRDAGFDGEIVLIGGEPHAPYDRPPLSKEFLAGSVGTSDLQLLPDADVRALDVETRYGVRVTGLDPVVRTVSLADGDVLPYDVAVLATGLEARLPARWADLPGVHSLRTLEDAAVLRAALGRASSVLLVGAGFIGCEIAASARSAGLDVTVVDVVPAPMLRALGSTAATFAAGLHREEGVRLELGHGLTELDGGGDSVRAVLADGGTVEADLAVIGIGATPATGWLAGSGLGLDEGVDCDEGCAAGPPGVYAAGDVARWWNPRFGEAMRVEHWTTASEMGRFAGRAAAGDPGSHTFRPVPYAWSDQYGIRFETAGRPRADDDLQVVRASPATREFLALYSRRGRVVGAVGINARRTFLTCRRLIQQGAHIDDALARCSVDDRGTSGLTATAVRNT